eukprot:g2394.t1
MSFLSKKDEESLNSYFAGKSVLITGGTGSFGHAMVKRLLQYSCRRIIVFSRDEWKQSEMVRSFSSVVMRYFLGDVRDEMRLRLAFRDVQVVFNAAALKQVPALEYNPSEAILTNVNGAMNVTTASLFTNVDRVVHLSTDKCVNPVNLYGASKLCAEKLFTAANALSGHEGTKFSVIRYGNVFGSRGSIVPLLHSMQESGDNITLTDLRMTRFNITVDQAIDFALLALIKMKGGEVFVPKLPSYRLPDLKEAIAPNANVRVIGRRPGEKVHELMVPKDEAYKTIDAGKYFIICPEKWKSTYKSKIGIPLPDDFEYSSNQNGTGQSAWWVSTATLREQYCEWCKQHNKKIQIPEKKK